MKKIKGFSLIELMIVIAIIGILASIAVPSYRSYIYKAKASEVYVTVSAAEKAVASHLISTGAASATGVCNPSGTPAFPAYSFTSTTNVASLSVDNNCVISSTASSAAVGSFVLTVTATPTVQADGSVKWACATSGTGKAFAPATCP